MLGDNGCLTPSRKNKTLFDDNMLNWHNDILVNDEAKWQHTLPLLREKPPLLFMEHKSLDFRLLEIEQVDTLLSGTSKHIDDALGTIIPFATTYRGDSYAFYPKLIKNGNMPIILAYHSSNCAVVLAQNLNDFIFRFMLEASVELNMNVSDEEGFRTALFAMLNSHKKYLTQKRIDILTHVYNSSISEYHLKKLMIPYRYMGFISREKIDSILKTEISFDLLDEELIF